MQVKKRETFVTFFRVCSGFICILAVVGPLSGFERQRTNINNLAWKFMRQDVTGAQAADFGDNSWLPVTIPHDFNGGIDGVHRDIFTAGPAMYRGIGWYRTRFSVNPAHTGRRVFIHFEGVSLVADVYINGQHAGQHKGGYTAFTFDITDKVDFSKPNILAVKVNSANDPTVAPWMQVPFGSYPSSYDYGVYGGIYRDVSILVTDNVYIQKVYLTTPDCSAQSSGLRVRTTVRNAGNATQSVKVTSRVIDAAGATILTLDATQSINAGATQIIEQTGTVTNPHLWSPRSPYLYRVHSIVSIGGIVVDTVKNPLGFRFFTLRNRQAFTINGEKMFLRGVNRHQDREGLGYALTDDQHRYDVAVIKDIGFNFLRHAHYPADPAVMDACDSLGLVVWLEIPVTVCISTDPAFLENARQQLTEMIEQNWNHPSVIVWGIGNESDNGAQGVHAALTESYTNTFHNNLNDLAHSLDNTRPTTGCNWKFASNQAIVDIYAPQEWSGWYGGDYHTYAPTMLIGEYGADIMIEKHHEEGFVAKWDQEYGARLLEYKVAKGEERSDLFPGHCIWIAFDFSSPRGDRVLAGGNSINYMNQKGLFLHDHTTPKDACYFYKSFYRKGSEAPMVYIVSHTWLNRWSEPAAKDIWAYGNCDTVELFNGLGRNSLGKRIRNGGELGNTRYEWDNVYVQYNVLYAEGRMGGVVVARDTIVLSNLPANPGDPDDFRRTNLALHKVSDYSAQENATNAAATIADGSTATRWSAQGYPNWVEFDLEKVYLLEDMMLKPYSNRAYLFTIEAKNSTGDPWRLICDGNQQTTSIPVVTRNLGGVEARHVRLTVVNAFNYDGGWASINEFELYGRPAPEVGNQTSGGAQLYAPQFRNAAEILRHPGYFRTVQLFDCRGRLVETLVRDGQFRRTLQAVSRGFYVLCAQTVDGTWLRYGWMFPGSAIRSGMR